MHKAATPRKRSRKKSADRAVGFGTCTIESDQSQAVILAAQQHEGRWYADYRLSFDKALGLKNRKESMTPSQAKLFDGQRAAIDEALNEAAIKIDALRVSAEQVAGGRPVADELANLFREVAAANAQRVAEQCNQSAPPVNVSKETSPLPEPAAPAGLLSIELTQLIDHPGNPDPAEQEIIAMMAWLLEESQQEPLTVRELADQPGRYEVLAGKTRLAAARRLGWEALQCRVRDDLADDLEAARFAATNNKMRREENPLRMVKWVAYLVEQGQGVEEAGGMYGWSGSYTRSMLGLLKLPKPWRERVEQGELAPTVAIRLNPYAAAEPIMQWLDKRWGDEWHRQILQDKNGIARQIQLAVESVTRPIEPKEKHRYSWELDYEHPRYFKLEDEHEESLRIVKLPIGKNGKLKRVALDAKAYDKLQIPLIKQKLAEMQSGGKSSKSKKPAAEMTPAEARAEEKRKRKQADEKLAKQLVEWKHRMLRQGIAQQVIALPSGSWQITLLQPVIAQACTTLAGVGAFQMAPLADLWQAACALSEASDLQQPPSRSLELLTHTLDGIDLDDDPITAAEQRQQWFLYLMLWPRLPGPVDGSKLSPDLPWGTLIPPLDASVIDRLAKLLEVTLSDQWLFAARCESAKRPTQQRELLEVFLSLHTRDQLNDLAVEICRDKPAAKVVAEQQTKTAAIEALLGMHKPNSMLKLPVSLGGGWSKKPARKKQAKK